MKSGERKYRKTKFCLFSRQTLVGFTLNEHFRHLCFTMRNHHGMHVRRWEECEKFPLFVPCSICTIFFRIFKISRINCGKMRNYQRRMKMVKRGEKSNRRLRGLFRRQTGFSTSQWHGHLLHFRDGSLVDGYKTTTRRNSAVNLCADGQEPWTWQKDVNWWYKCSK